MIADPRDVAEWKQKRNSVEMNIARRIIDPRHITDFKLPRAHLSPKLQRIVNREENRFNSTDLSHHKENTGSSPPQLQHISKKLKKVQLQENKKTISFSEEVIVHKY